MRIFVTGASGFIGSHLVNKLDKSKNEVVVLVRDIIPSKWLDEALEGCVKVRGDILNFKLLRRVINHYEINQIYHLAALPKVKTAYRDPISTFETNIMGTVNILEASRLLDVNKTVVMATDKVYGTRMNAKVGDPLEASEPYATSKACADLTAQSFIKTYDLNVVIVRSCNVYGYDLNNRIVPNTVKACLEGRSPLIFEEEKKSVRQYIYVEDTVEALIHLMSEHQGMVNVCTKDLFNQEDVVLKILQFFPEVKPKYVKRHGPREIERQSMVLTDFGWKPQYTFEKGIKLTIEALKKWGM